MLHPYPLTNFFLQPKEDTPDYFPPRLWATHLPLFRTVDHQPAPRVMEGETQPTFPQVASPLAQHGDMHGGGLGEGGAVSCQTQSSFSVDVPAGCRACSNTKMAPPLYLLSPFSFQFTEHLEGRAPPPAQEPSLTRPPHSRLL